METLLVNLSSVARRETLYGREYLVAPMTLIVPGVLNGSKGPLFYPTEEISRYPELWENRPIVINHPPGGAANPENLNRYKVGFLLNSRIENKKLTADGWFEVSRLSSLPKILDSLRNGTPIELSTGLRVDVANTPGVDEKGKSYVGVATNYRPDHLAILPDSVGACSIADGCGVLVNELTELITGLTENSGMSRELLDRLTTSLTSLSTKEDRMEKTKLIDDLISNCSCFTEEDRETLNGFSEVKIQSLIDSAKEKKAAEKVANSAKAGFKTSDGGTTTWNEEKGEWVHNAKAPETTPSTPPNPATPPQEKVTKSDILNALKDLSAEEYYDLAPPEVQEVINESVNFKNRTKQELIDKLVANVSDEIEKEALKKDYALMSLEGLQRVLNQSPSRSNNNPFRPDYSGSAPASSGQVDNIQKPTPLGIPRWDFAEKN